MGKTSSRRLAAIHHVQARQYQGCHFMWSQLHFSVSKAEVGCELRLGWEVGIYLAGVYISVSILSFLSLKNICKRRNFQKNSGSWRSSGIQNVLERWPLEAWGFKWGCVRHLTPAPHQQHDSLCMFQDSYLGSNIQCLNKTRMRLPLQAWAMVTDYFSRVGWTGQLEGLRLADPTRPCLSVILAAHCSIPAAAKEG